MINHQYKVIFLHIPRTGGTSIEKIFGVEKHHGKIHHRLPLQVMEDHKDEWNNYFKFTIVRNPWDRAVSTFFFCTKTFPRIKKMRIRNPKFLKYKGNFELFMNDVSNKEFDFLRLPCSCLQTLYLLDKNNEPYDINYVGRFEKLGESIDYVGQRVGMSPVELLHISKSFHRPYYEYYNSKTVELVYNIYKKDIDYLRYDFI